MKTYLNGKLMSEADEFKINSLIAISDCFDGTFMTNDQGHTFFDACKYESQDSELFVIDEYKLKDGIENDIFNFSCVTDDSLNYKDYDHVATHYFNNKSDFDQFALNLLKSKFD